MSDHYFKVTFKNGQVDLWTGDIHLTITSDHLHITGINGHVVLTYAPFKEIEKLEVSLTILEYLEQELDKLPFPVECPQHDVLMGSQEAENQALEQASDEIMGEVSETIPRKTHINIGMPRK